MRYTEISIEHINVPDYLYKLHLTRNFKALRRSLEAIGLISPLVVVRENSGSNKSADFFTLLHGLTRLEALQDLGYDTVPARVFEKEELSDFCACLRLYCLENRYNRRFSPVEKAYLFEMLMDYSDECREELMDISGLPKSKDRLAQYKRILELPQPIIDALHQLKVEPDEVFLLYELEPADRLPIFSLFMRELGVRYNDLKKLLNLFKTLKLKGFSIAQLLSSDGVNEILRKQLPPREKYRALYDYFYKMAFTELMEMHQNFEQWIRSLNPPANVKINPSKNFEKDIVRIEIEYTSQTNTVEISDFIKRLQEKPWYR